MKKSEVKELINRHIPTNWLHPLLTGNKAVIGAVPYHNRDVERLLLSIKEAMLKELNSPKKTNE